MKVRIGFVSNSSSCSFMIYGVQLEGDEIEQVFKVKFPEQYAEMGDDFSSTEAAEELTRGTNLSVESNYDWGSTWIGRSMDEIGDDETGAQFKKSVEDEIERLFGKKMRCAVFAESWYNG